MSSRAAPATVELRSPDGRIKIALVDDRITVRVTYQGATVIEPSPVGIIVDGINFGERAKIVRTDKYRQQEQYPTRGVHSQATNHFNGMRISFSHPSTQDGFTVDLRAFDDGIAFRTLIPGAGKKRVPDEATTFTLPDGSVVWYHDHEGHYEGIHSRKELTRIAEGEWAAPPLTIKLPGQGGYAAITEAALINFAGMVLQTDGKRGFRARLGHSAPPSYPFRLRYAGDVERLAIPAPVEGTIVTPWRVVMIGANLNTLVNCDIVSNVSPAPDPHLFPRGFDTEWIKPGRAVWKYLDGGENTLGEMKEFSRLAAELGFGYNIIEGFWQRWSEAELRDLVTYSRERDVGIWLWKHTKDLRAADAREKFFRQCRDAGVKGVKLDFFDHEAKEIIDLYQTLLKEAAEAKLMVDFHGANKPAGESRTWPNEMTREGIYGLEHRRTESWAGINTILPFTRMLAGHADYTPVHFGERRRETSWPHQIATAAIFTSPVLIYGAHPKNLLSNPAVEVIKSIPATWDETIALEACEIGELAAFARRSGSTWFLAVLNGATARTLRIPMSFLGQRAYDALLVRDDPSEAASVKLEKTRVNARDLLRLDLRAGGGFIGRFTP